MGLGFQMRIQVEHFGFNFIYPMLKESNFNMIEAYDLTTVLTL